MRINQNTNHRIDIVDQGYLYNNLKNPNSILCSKSENVMSKKLNENLLKDEKKINRLKLRKSKINLHWSSKIKDFQPTTFGPEILSIRKLTGQRPYVTNSKKGVARLGIREGARSGIKVTLRGRNKFRFYKLYFTNNQNSSDILSGTKSLIGSKTLQVI